MDFVQIELYESFLISTIFEGVVFEEKQLKSFCKIFDDYFPNKSFGYISNRKFDYSVNPTCYLDPSKYPNLLGIAIVCHKESSVLTATFEKQFYKRPMEVFFDLKEGKEWVNQLVVKKEKASL